MLVQFPTLQDTSSGDLYLCDSLLPSEKTPSTGKTDISLAPKSFCGAFIWNGNGARSTQTRRPTAIP